MLGGGVRGVLRCGLKLRRPRDGPPREGGFEVAACEAVGCSSGVIYDINMPATVSKAMGKCGEAWVKVKG